MRVDAERGHKILQGKINTLIYDAPSRNLDDCPHKQGDLVPLHFPQVATDSYGQPLLDKDGEKRYAYSQPAHLRITQVELDTDDGKYDPMFVVHFRLEYPDRDEFLQRVIGRTHTEARAIDDAGIYVDPETLDPRHYREAEERWQRAQDPAAQARKLAKRLRAA